MFCRFFIDSILFCQVVRDLKTARQRQTIAKRETKGLEQKIDLLTRKLYKLTNDTKQAEENYTKATTKFQLMDNEQTKLDKVLALVVKTPAGTAEAPVLET